MTRIMIAPLAELGSQIHRAASTLNLTTQFKTNDQAEIGNLAAQLNQLMERISSTLREIMQATEKTDQLAQRTQPSTAEIQSMIDNLRSASSQVANQMEISSKSSQQGLTSLEETRQELAIMAERLALVFDMNSDIAHNTQAQLTAVEEVHYKLQELSQQGIKVTRF